MTVLDLPRTTQPTVESTNLLRLRTMLTDEAHRADWPDIQRAIDYLTATTVRAA
jgi:hypothetical protein